MVRMTFTAVQQQIRVLAINTDCVCGGILNSCERQEYAFIILQEYSITNAHAGGWGGIHKS